MGIEDENTGEASGLDISSAVAGIADDLGFSSEGEADLETGAEEIAATSPEEPTDAPEVPEDGEAPPADAAAELPEPPKTWRKEALEHWATIPDTVRAEILKREDDMFRGLEGYKSQANIGRAFQETLARGDPARRWRTPHLCTQLGAARCRPFTSRAGATPGYDGQSCPGLRR